MANVFSQTSTYGTNSLVTAAYDKMVGFALRSEPQFREVIAKKPADVSHAGSSIRLFKHVEMAAATTALTETVDPDSVALGGTTYVDITLNEYGNAVLTTEKLAVESLSAIDPAVANLIAFNMRDSLDTLVQTVVRGNQRIVRNTSAGGTTLAAVTNGSGNANTVTATSYLTSPAIRYTVAKLRGASAQTFGGKYVGYIHPDVSHDLRAETGAAAWRDIHNYSGAGSVWAGEIGEYEGVRFIETPRCYSATDGAASASVKRTYIFGQEAIAEAVGREPGVVVGPMTDKLLRFRPVGWKALLGWAIYREEALWQIQTASSI